MGIPKQCSRPGCPNTSTGGLCEEHKRDRHKLYDQVRRDKESKKFYNSDTWKRVRSAKLARDPFCQMQCADQEPPTLATTVHHKDGNIWNLTDDNLQSACASCHSSYEIAHHGQ